MAFDLTLPKTGVTQFGELYSVLRDNFNGLYDKHIRSVSNVGWTWVTTGLGTNWTIGSGGFAYMKNVYGFVYLRGYIYASGTATGTIWTLPENYRPGYARIYYAGLPYDFSSITIQPQLTVNTSGTIVASLYDSGIAYCMDGISFMAGD